MDECDALSLVYELCSLRCNSKFSAILIFPIATIDNY